MHIDSAIALVRTRLLPRWPHATAAIIGGSIARGEATPTSDIDLLLLFEKVDRAWRDTLKVDGQTVELFGHDPSTFDYFCRRIDAPNGTIPLAMMVIDGVAVLPPGASSDALGQYARQLYAAGPPAWDSATLAARRYAITTLVEDLQDSERSDETLAIAVKLYDTLATFALRAGGHWTGTGKHLARRLKAAMPDLAAALEEGMGRLAADPERARAVLTEAARRALAPHGGWLLEGFHAPAPADWRSDKPPFA